MNQLEMLQALMENPKRKAQQIKNCLGHGVNGSYKLYVDNINRVVWSDSHNPFTFFVANEKSEWEIIEPERKLKEMCFGEVYYEWALYGGVQARDVRSMLSGLDYERNFYERTLSQISREEMMGKWTIEGIYEDESEEK